VQEQYRSTSESCRLGTERENLIYVLDHTELTEAEQSDVKLRLAAVENELLQLFHRLPRQLAASGPN